MLSTKIISAIISFFLILQINAQQTLISKTNSTSFYSKAPLEDIKALNEQTTAALDLEKKEIVVKMLIKHFNFKKSLMQEHFNENYMESHKFPSAVFKGKIITDQDLNLSQKGTYEVMVLGSINLHGVERELESPATLVISENSVTANAEFILRPADFDIKIPKMVIKNIAEDIKVTTDLTFEI